MWLSHQSQRGNTSCSFFSTMCVCFYNPICKNMQYIVSPCYHQGCHINTREICLEARFPLNQLIAMSVYPVRDPLLSPLDGGCTTSKVWCRHHPGINHIQIDATATTTEVVQDKKYTHYCSATSILVKYTWIIIRINQSIFARYDVVRIHTTLASGNNGACPRDVSVPLTTYGFCSTSN